MDTFRSEFLKYCIGFTLLVGIILIYAGIWSLNSGFGPGEILVSTMSIPIWLACGLFFGGSALSAGIMGRSTTLAGWLLCISVGAAIFSILTDFSNPYGVVGFLLPILFSTLLFNWKQVTSFVVLVLVSSTYINTGGFKEPFFRAESLIPILIIVLMSIFILLIINELSSSFKWYQQKYLSELKNEQIIRDDEVKLERLVRNMNDFQKYLTTTNEQLIKARDEAEKARNVKQLFVQNVSHEIRTPLNLIIGFSEAMINTPGSYGEVNWTPDLKGDIECIYQNSQHLKSLIDDVLDMAALENKKYEIEPGDVDINSIVHEVTLITENSYTSKGLYLETDFEDKVLMVQADTVRIKQVILNLFSNALKYTSTGGVTISTQRDEQTARVIVEDTGKGIPEDALEKVFEAFYQVDKSSNREDSGTGLGLSISRQLIELHGGEMQISSQVGKGTTVSFTLPLSK